MNQSEFLAITCNSLKAQEKSCVRGVIGFGFTSHWLKNWHESFKPITKRINRNHIITFDSHLKTGILSEFGDLYMWGWNEKGQLGLTVSHDDEEDRQSSIHQIQCQALPALVNLPGDLDVLTVSCGTRHTAIVAGK